MLRNWGVTRLAAHEHDESIDEMKHADLLIERILFLEGWPNLTPGPLLIGQTVADILDCDLKLEQKGLLDLRPAIAHCEAEHFGTRDLLSGMLDAEEKSVDFLETQMHLIEKIGVENCVQIQSEGAKPGSD
jgi:bacterioferritin